MKKIIALLLSAAMVLGCLPALAENTKHERVYVAAAADGTVKSITDSVRLENTDGLDEILDRTLLTGIRNAGGDESFTLTGEDLTWQANGKDIIYQGTSDKMPAILPAVKLTLDGSEVSFTDLKDRTGDAVLTVTYPQTEKLPALAVTVLPLPEKGVTDLKLENAAVLSEMGQQVLVGWAVPGADEKLNLPGSFTASFHAEHADLKWMMTFSTSDPVDAVCRELDQRMDLDLHTETEELRLLLTAMQNGEELPETTGKTREIAPKINELNNGLTQLSDGAASLADGASQLHSGTTELKDGAAKLSGGAASLTAGAVLSEAGAKALDEGLTALTANSEKLNSGAEALFAAVLDSANQQLAAAGLDAAGIKIPELTAENYADVLDGVLAQLNPAPKEGDSGKGDAAVPAAAKAAYESLSALKGQLDQVHTFVTGLKAYTDGAAQASAGAATLHTGLTQLREGAAALSEGAAKLSDGAAAADDGASQVSSGADALKNGTKTLKETITIAEKAAAGKLLPYAENELADALRIYEETRDSVRDCGYDLRPEGMKADTVYVIRTDLY
jgi:putative membrane protein